MQYFNPLIKNENPFGFAQKIVHHYGKTNDDIELCLWKAMTDLKETPTIKGNESPENTTITSMLRQSITGFVSWLYEDNSAFCCFPSKGSEGSYVIIDLVNCTVLETPFPDFDFDENFKKQSSVVKDIYISSKPAPKIVKAKETKTKKQKIVKEKEEAIVTPLEVVAKE